MRNTPPKSARPARGTKRRLANRYSKTVARWLVFCFPAGLMMMWSDRCRWPVRLKTLISTGIACLVLAVVLPQTLPPPRVAGGVKIVGLNGAVELQGPAQQECDEGGYEVYVPVYIKPTSVIVEPTPTPEPIYVYCNVGGKYYHVKNCRFFKNTSARVTLGQALTAGYHRCTECASPQEFAEQIQ